MIKNPTNPELNSKTERSLLKDIFECRQVEALRAPNCTRKGYKHGKKQGICSVCIGYSIGKS